MESNKRIAELLVETGAFKSLDKPVILTSGELGIYYINTEKLCQDGGEFERYGDDAGAMVMHAFNMMRAHPTFKEVIEIIASKVSFLLEKENLDHPLGISGGQRREIGRASCRERV